MLWTILGLFFFFSCSIFLHTDWWTTLCVCLRFFPLTTVKFCRGFADSFDLTEYFSYFTILRSCSMGTTNTFDFEEKVLFVNWTLHIILFVTFLLPLQTAELLFVHRKSFNWVYLLLFCSTELNYVCKTMYACVYVLYGVSTPGFCNK